MDRIWAWLLSNVVALAISVYIYRVVRSKPLGNQRLLYSLPVFPIYFLIPLVFDPKDYVVGVVILFACFCWLGSFRLLTFCWGFGPASDSWIDSNFFRFHAALCLPIHIRPANRHEKKDEGKKNAPNNQRLDLLALRSYLFTSEEFGALAIRFLFKSLVISLILKRYDTWKSFHPLVAEYIFSFCLYLFVTVVCEFVAAVSNGVFGVQVEPHFNMPFISSSLEEFWARRWNIMVSSNLRETIYIPTINFLCPFFKTSRPVSSSASKEEGDAQKSRSEMAPKTKKYRVQFRRKNGQVFTEELEIKISTFLVIRMVAMFNAFLVSGIMHELMFMYFLREITGEVTVFFVLHGIATAVELLLRRQLSATAWSRIPNALRVVVTTGFALVTAHHLFFGPLHRKGLFPLIVSGMRSTLPF